MSNNPSFSVFTNLKLVGNRLSVFWRAKRLLAWLCVGYLCACQSSNPTLLATQTIPSTRVPVFTATQLQPTATQSPSPTTTATPTLTLTPSLTPTPTPLACWNTPGNAELGSLASERLRFPMEYGVYLPPCYSEQPQRRYPVLYMIHGQSYNHDQWDRLGADEMMFELVSKGEISPFIIVMPRNRSWEQPTEDMFGAVLADELIPFIDQHYRTLPDRAHRAIGGLSRGASWAVHLGVSRWELFGAIGGHSLPVFWSDTPHIRSWLAEIPVDEYPRIFLDIGEKDRPQILASARWFENLLTERDIPHEWYLYPGYHEEAYWQAHLEQYIRWYAQDW